MNKKIRQNNKNFHLKAKITSLTSIFLTFLFCFSFLNPTLTFAYFDSFVSATDNKLTAGTLDVSSSNTDFGVINLDTNQDYSVLNQGSLDFDYEITPNLESGSNTDFCNQLNITFTKGTSVLYSGLLSGLSMTNLLDSSNQDNLSFIVKDPSSSGAGKTCNFSFILKARQPTLDFTQGFTDQESTTLTFYSANIEPTISTGVVLNEFLPHPDGEDYDFDFGSDSSDMPQGEWVELYNNGNVSVDLTGWYLADASNGNGNKTPINTDHLLASNSVIESHGWLVVYMNKKTYNNTGDTVKLFDNNDNLIDSYSYGVDPTACTMEPTSDGTNNTTPSGTCNASNVPKNKSFARIPDGVGAWVDPIPTPGQANKLEEEPIVEGGILDEGETVEGLPEEIPLVEEAVSETDTPEESPQFAPLPEEIPLVEEFEPTSEPEVPEEISSVSTSVPEVEETIPETILDTPEESPQFTPLPEEKPPVSEFEPTSEPEVPEEISSVSTSVPEVEETIPETILDTPEESPQFAPLPEESPQALGEEEAVSETDTPEGTPLAPEPVTEEVEVSIEENI